MNKNPVVLFFKLIRPIFLVGGFLQYALGAGIAKHIGIPINQEIFILGALWILAVQLATHFFNEYYDSELDAMNPNRTLFSGGSGVLGESEGQLPRRLGILSAATMLTAVLLLTYGLMRSGTWNISIGIIAMLIFIGGIFYSVPPLQLSRTGYGELTTSILLANLVPAFGLLLQSGEFHYLLAMSTFPLTGLALALMISVEFPDYATDMKYEKLTLLVRVGWKMGMRLHNTAVLSSFGLLGLAAFYGFPTNVVLPALLPLPLGLIQIWYMNRIANGIKPNWSLLTFNAISLFGLTSYILGFTLWTR